MLASMLLESAGLQGSGLSAKEAARYTAEDGAMLIAQESAMEMYEIFSNEFIAMEELEIRRYQATMEGISVEDSVMEGIGSSIKEKIKGAFDKLVEQLKKLRDKVLAFLNDMKRRLDSIFMDGTAFAKKYEKDLRKLKLSGYEKEGFNYNIEEWSNDILNNYKNYADEATGNFELRVKMYSGGKDATDKGTESIKKTYEDLLLKFLNNTYQVEETSEVAEKLWSDLRGGAKDKSDTQSVDCSRIDRFISVLKESRKQLDMVAKAEKTTRGVYDKAIKAMNTTANKADADGRSNDATLARAYVSYITGVQNATNTALNQIYGAMVERVKFYKKVCVGAFTYKADK